MLLSEGCGIKPQHVRLPRAGTAQSAAQLQVKLLRCLTVLGHLSTVPGGISKSPVSTWESAWDHFNAKKHEDGCSSMYGTGQKWHGQWGYAPEALILSYFILTIVLKLASVHYFSFSILNMQALRPLDDARSVRFTLGISMYLHRKQKNPTPRFGPTLQLILVWHLETQIFS